MAEDINWNYETSPTNGKKYSSGAAGGDMLAKRTAAESAKNRTVRHTPAPLPKGKTGGMPTV